MDYVNSPLNKTLPPTPLYIQKTYYEAGEIPPSLQISMIELRLDERSLHVGKVSAGGLETTGGPTLLSSEEEPPGTGTGTPGTPETPPPSQH